MFSDGRQCTMARSDIHPSLCTYHSDREDQLFGDPGGSFVTRKLDLPELYSACRDLTTAASVSRALGQVFRLLAQHRISRQEAATFAKLGHLLLQSISAARSESVSNAVDARSSDAHPKTEPPAKAGPSFRATIWSEESLSHPPMSQESRPQLTPASCDAPSAPNSLRMNTSESAACNSPEINTYETTELKPVHNQHLHKNPREAPMPQAFSLCDQSEK
jgi:hypothetical protein